MRKKVLALGSLCLTAVIGWSATGFAEEKAAPSAANTAADSTTAPAVAGDENQLSPETEAKLKQALEKFSQSDIPGTVEILKEIAAADPKVVPPRLILAQWFSQTNNTNAVRTSLEQATEETPNDPEAYILLGEIALRQGEWTAADLLFQKGETVLAAYTVNEERQKTLNIRLLKLKVTLAQMRERWPQMQAALGALLKLEGESPEICRQIAASFFYMDKEKAANDWFLRADQIDSEKGLPADAQMAVLYMNKEKTEQAKESLAKALAANPQSIPVLNISLSIALKEGDLARADQLASQLYAADAKNPETLKNCGIVALYREDYPAAEKYFTAAVVSDPNNTEITNGLALALCEQKVPEKTRLALQYATGNLQKQENNREFLSTLGWVLYQSGDKERALKVLQQSAADGQVNTACAYYLAVILNDQGETENAKKLLTAVSENKTPFFKRNAALQLLQKIQ